VALVAAARPPPTPQPGLAAWARDDGGSPTPCAGFNRPTDIVGVAPRIARLRSNGGATQTIALRKGSAAINKAKRSTAPKKDGGGRMRARMKDTGALEHNTGH
jgi:hypothetical protein